MKEIPALTYLKIVSELPNPYSTCDDFVVCHVALSSKGQFETVQVRFVRRRVVVEDMPHLVWELQSPFRIQKEGPFSLIETLDIEIGQHFRELTQQQKQQWKAFTAPTTTEDKFNALMQEADRLREILIKEAADAEGQLSEITRK